MDLLDDLSGQLHALTSAQPAQPGDRVPGVTRRARRIRRTRAAVAVAAAAAVLAPAGLLLSSQHHDAGPQFARSDVLTWPDRSDRAETRISGDAVRAYQADHPDASSTVTWLARKAVLMPNRKPAHLAVFLATEGSTRSLVVMSRRDDLPNAEGTWGDVTSTRLEPGTAPDHVGLYLTYNRTDAAGFGNMAFLLADPRARSLRWREQPLPFAPPSSLGVSTGSATSSDGTFVVDVGQLVGPLEASVTAKDAGESFQLSLTDDPDLIRPELAVPPSWEQTGGGAFQSDRAENGWSGPRYSVFTTSDAVLLECYGGGVLRADVTGGPKEAVLSSAQVPCDGQAHPVRGQGRTQGRTGASLVVHPTQLQVITFVTGRTQ